MNADLAAELPPQIVRSPEGVDLRFHTATASERLVAFAIDLAIVLLLFVVGVWLFAVTLGVGVALLWFFLLRHGWFLWSEVRGRGTTIGKRRFGLRVIRADGGPLTTEILLARNLTREVEFFLPTLLLLNPDLLFAGHEGVVRTLAGMWVLALLFFPLCNAQRLRIGDLLAGTRVVRAPAVTLARDLADHRPAAAAKADGAADGGADGAVEFVFEPGQLGIYGEHELSVLEEVLRKARAEGADEALAAVAKSIAKKIAWADAAAVQRRPEPFLRAFYQAQRQHLEQQLLLGRRRLRKQGKGTRETRS